MAYEFKEAATPWYIEEQQYKTQKDFNGIRFSLFTSCIGVMGRNGKIVTGVHLVLVGNGGNFDKAAADETIRLLGSHTESYVVGDIRGWKQDVKEAYTRLIDGLTNPKEIQQEAEDRVFGGRVIKDKFELFEGKYSAP
jgi:hypothetical protein